MWDDVRTFWEGIMVPILVLAGIAGGLLGGWLFLIQSFCRIVFIK